MKQFIKLYWAHILLMILGSVLTSIKIANQEWTNSFIALALVIVTGTALFTRVQYDLLKDDYEDVVRCYIKELTNNINFIERSKQKLADIMLDVKQIKEESGTALIEGKPKKKKTKKKAE